ncbi:purine-nucleoside phosphorylase [Pseudobacteriovorax antillogorgiicola]|uniref:Uridine phosphorylase n=1 Tax=Pseudobacteriovorax antillogorgiicola TaxID=1513793 RepID=A0A1Y6CP06_9BACT|nr:purine-nucleoside phosphorylase [Pseudobacteriovorax antillogorgiicola]TCS47019.1 purine-nucleoside phosphorylase [Pseudobacteriovorax antillogorgiicola]SMF65182.1 purine-nucleoside phosphorylase [Pseudobacteriovorax antillogorgiicola]
MSHHIAAKQGDIAETVLLPGDPLRAKFVAETFLEEPFCYTDIRNMLGFTGTYKGKRISVQGTGMGQPSLAIYGYELIQSYQAKNLIRIGSCGALNKTLKLRDIIIAMGACTDGSMNRITFNGQDYAAIADFSLLQLAYEKAVGSSIATRIGNVLATDRFYGDDLEALKPWTDHQVLAVEMESNVLYTLAARYGARALSILTVSDSLVTNENLPARQRESSFEDMARLALDVAVEA